MHLQVRPRLNKVCDIDVENNVDRCGNCGVIRLDVTNATCSSGQISFTCKAKTMILAAHLVADIPECTANSPLFSTRGCKVWRFVSNQGPHSPRYLYSVQRVIGNVVSRSPTFTEDPLGTTSLMQHLAAVRLASRGLTVYCKLETRAHKIM